MRREELLLLLQDIVEETSELVYLKKFYTENRKNDLEVIKKIIIYGLENNLFELLKHETTDQKNILKSVKVAAIKTSLEIIKDDIVWDTADYCLCFSDTSYYFPILFGPNGPVGDHAMEGAKIPEEFEQFIVDE